MIKPRPIFLTLAALLACTVAWACSQFSAVDDGPDAGEDGGRGSNGVDDSATDGAADTGDGSIAMPDVGPSVSCLQANDAGNVTITTVPATPRINEPIEVEVEYAFSAGTETVITLEVCTPAGALGTIDATSVVQGSDSRTSKFAIDAGIATPGRTQLHFVAGPTPRFEGASTITVDP